MAQLKVPSLQHLARNWHSDPKVIKRHLVTLARNSPTFNYNPLFGAVRDMLVFNVAYEQIEKGIQRGTRRLDVRENYLSVLPLIRDCFAGVKPTFVQDVSRRYYPVGRGLLVPFAPPLIYGLGGRIHFPWFSFWRSNPIASQRLSLFVSMVDDLLQQDPDLDGAEFTILDFSVQGRGRERELTPIDAATIARLTEDSKRAMLEVFAEGYLLAQSELSKSTDVKPNPESSTRDPGLFDEP